MIAVMRREFQSIKAGYQWLVVSDDSDLSVRILGGAALQRCDPPVPCDLGFSLRGSWPPLYGHPNSFIFATVFSRSTFNSSPRLRSPSTTLVGAFARNCSLLNCRWPLAISFSIFSNSFLRRSHSATTSIFFSYIT